MNKKIPWLLILILAVAAFFRFYNLRDYLVFLGDEGRDVIIVKGILQGNFTLLGPTASVGGFYLGPIYYYMMAPFLLLSNFDPVGPAYFISIIGTATVYLVYLFGKKFFHQVVGLSAAFLYAIAPLIVRYSRASWNPNPLPFFSLLGIYLLSLGVKLKRKPYLFLSGACLGIAWQLHYLALILAPIYLILIFNNFKKPSTKSIPSRLLMVTLGWLVSFSPFLAFEVRHRFPNTRTILEFITRDQGAVNFKLIDIFTNFYDRAVRLFFEVFSLPQSALLITLTFVLVIALIHASRKRNKALLIWFFAGLIGMSLYQGDIHDYYFGFLFPVPFLMAGIFIYLLWIRGRLGQLFSLGLLIIISVHFINGGFFSRPPNRIVDQTQTITNLVLKLAAGQPYNFALISTGNSDHAYRYFLNISSNPPVLLQDQVTPQLLVVCEQPPEICEPRGHPAWELAGFGRKEIVDRQLSPVGNITVFKTIHHQSSLDMIGKPAVKGG